MAQAEAARVPPDSAQHGDERQPVVWLIFLDAGRGGALCARGVADFLRDDASAPDVWLTLV